MVDRTREWKDLPRLDPGFVLRELRKLETILPETMDPKVRALREREQRRFLEGRQGCLFCFGMGKRLGVPALFIQTESQDYDGVAVCRDGNTENYAPLQLKELVPAKLNPSDTLRDRLAALSAYTDSADLTVVIHHTRGGRIEPDTITIPERVNLAGIYIIAAISPDEEKWAILGDFSKHREEWRSLEFDYPT